MSGSPKKRPRPSYEEGKVRDKRIEELQDKAATGEKVSGRSLLVKLLRKTARPAG